MRKLLSIALATLTLSAGASAAPPDFPALRVTHPTALTRVGPSPQASPGDLTPPDAVEMVTYPSSSLKLNGWLSIPNDGRAKHAAVVFLHGGFAFDLDDFEMGRPFLDAGYAVFYPWMRGENGNPGHFELMYGEVDDVLAAVRWLRADPRIDAEHVAIFGHSIGGGAADLTALYPDRGVVLSGSIGALYEPRTFAQWARFAPFDTRNETENVLRSLVANLGAMRGKHIAYFGKDEPRAAGVAALRDRARAVSAPLSVEIVPGDHETSVPAAMAAFIQALKSLP